VAFPFVGSISTSIPRTSSEDQFMIKHFLFLTLCSTILGCGSPLYNLSGQVTFDGSPLPNGRISFICDGADKPVRSSEIQQGAYYVTGLPEGDAKVIIETFNRRADPVPGGPPPEPVPKDYKFIAIPKHYADSQKSGLKVKIQADLKNKNFDLESDKKTKK
jgi:hypothetical protein